MSSLTTPPGQLGLPLLGETLAFLRDPDFAKKRHRQYGPIFKTQLLGNPTVFLKGAAANDFVLSHENQYFVVSWPPSVKRLLGPLSLALQTGALHLQRRKLLAQAFQPRALTGYVPVLAAISEQYLERWVALETLTWYPELRNYTFDIAGKLLIGLDNAAQTELGHWFATWCEGLFSLPLRLPWTRFGKAYRCREQLLKGLETLIRERQQAGSQGSDALGVLLRARDEDGQPLGLEELKDQVLLLLFAGHETLTSALASFCLLLAQHPAVKDRARAEQSQFRGVPLSLETLKQMTYLEQVLKEVLRCIAPVGGGFRQVLQSCEFGGFLLPQGWSVLYEINLTHQDSELFLAPEQFDPGRFSPERAEDKVKPFSHVPFGGGVRECLGKEFARLELKLFAAKLLQGYDWSLLPQDLTLVTVPTPHPKDGLKVQFYRQPLQGLSAATDSSVPMA
ncbi:cytochrome P450 [Leptolyngbya sp. FACHB-321]|uniref:cytochrome P450 n=1 Tax=Leptolyngbya sp. FACHB-321 TaxID=2692807 RepID=UPI001684BA01|nr:cytochrome P450 [Leptolyngbya sp. FACHB-321]MBD2036280.1 cytochrome P450 [Leptolyngbya sp. FACHB-321]